MSSKDWRSGSSSSDDDDSVDFSPSLQRSQTRDTVRKLSFGVEHSDDKYEYSLVKADEAQGVYPPSCCVFVAK